MENQTPVAPEVQSTVNSEQSTVEQKTPNTFLVVLLSVLLFISVSIAGFFAYQTQKLVAEVTGYREQLKQTLEPTTNNLQPSSTPDPTADWKTYTNTKYGYSLKYPNNWVMMSIEPGPADLPLNTTSRGIVVYPSIYKSSAMARALVQLETDGPENLAYKGFDDWLNTMHNSFYKVESTTQEGLAGLSGETSTGTYDGYGFPANIKRFALKSLNGRIYYSLTSTLEQNSVEAKIVDQILSTFKFTN